MVVLTVGAALHGLLIPLVFTHIRAPVTASALEPQIIM